MDNNNKLIVSDTGPLISWARAGYVPLLRKLIPALVVPTAVVVELSKPGRPGADLLLEGPWLSGRVLPPSAVLDGFPGLLGPGERQAISLAVHLGADYILMDDGRAVAEAKKRGIEVLRTLRLLGQAQRTGLVSLVKPILDDFALAGFWLAESVRQAFLDSIGEA